MTAIESLGEELDKIGRVSHRYGSVITSIEGRGCTLSAQEAFDAEIERLAMKVEPYLAAYREWLEAASLHGVLNNMDLGRGLDSAQELKARGMFDELAKRVETTKTKRDRLGGQNRRDVDRLKLLLLLRRAEPRPERVTE